MVQALVPDRLFTGDRMADGLAVLVEAGRVAAVVPRDALDPAIPARRLRGLLAPGFVDTQVNGGGGVLFNDAPTPEALRRIGEAHRRFGTTAFLPTLISDRPDVMRRALEAAEAAVGAGLPGVLGIHLEGPFLSVERRGVHVAEAIRAPDRADLDLLTAPRRGLTMVTVAPETVGDDTIAQLARSGIIVSLGHTAADHGRTVSALRNGATGFTHLFNAMPPLAGRSPGPVGAALDDAHSWCGLIADLHHVHPASLGLAIRAKGPSRLMLVTDAMSTVGTDLPGFTLQGREILRKDGRLTAEDGTLAGSDLDMATAVRNCVRHLGVPLADALRMASLSPAAFLGLDREIGRIVPGYRADLVLLDDGIAVRGTWIAGEPDEATGISGEG
jgi:N-acetylglucosamine-6-phosphate deacetylase